MDSISCTASPIMAAEGAEMHSAYPQLGHFYPQLGGSGGRFYPQLGAMVYDEGFGRHQDYYNQVGQGGQLGASIDIGSIVSSALDKAIGILPTELKNQVLNSPLGQQVVQQTSDVAYQLGADQAAAQAASYWTAKQQQLQTQFTDILNYTKSNYQKILTYAGIAAGALALMYFGWPVVKGMIASKPMAAASNPRRRRKHRRNKRRHSRRK